MNEQKLAELTKKIIELMEKYQIKVYDSFYVDELIEKTLERAEKECSH